MSEQNTETKSAKRDFKAEYAPPVDRLLDLGIPPLLDSTEPWRDYVADLGFGPEHIPDLIRLATDKQIYYGALAESEPSSYIYAPVHAWRALAQLHAEAASEPLITMFDGYDDWVYADMPQVYAMLGPSALGALRGYLSNPVKTSMERHLAGVALLEIAKKYPEARQSVVAALVETLANAGTEPDLAAFMVDHLLQLKATEAIPEIERAFKEDRVDTSMVTWDMAQVDLGLKPDQEVNHERLARQGVLAPAGPLLPNSPGSSPPVRSHQPNSAQKAKAKAKRKMAKASQRKNRK